MNFPIILFSITPVDVIQTALLLLCATSLVLWAVALFRNRDCMFGLFPSLVPARSRQVPFWHLGDPMIMFGLTLLLTIGAAVLLGGQPLGSPPPTEESPTVSETVQISHQFKGIGASLVGTSMAFFVTLIFLCQRHHDPLTALGLRVNRDNILLGLKGIVMILPPVLIFAGWLDQLVQYEHPVLNILSETTTPARVAVVFLSTVIVAPITEEFLYRGLLTGALERLASSTVSSPPPDVSVSPVPAAPSQAADDKNPYLPPATTDTTIDTDTDSLSESWTPTHWWPIIVSSVVFALLHLGHGAAPIALFFFALALGYLYRRTGSLIAPIIVHLSLNFISLAGATARTHWGG